MASRQLNRDAVPWEPNKVPHRQPLPAPVPPPAVTYQYPTNYNYISDQCHYYYYYHYSYYCSSYKNTTTNHQSAVVVDPSSEGSGQYGVVLRSSGQRKVMETYERSAVMRFEGGSGPNNLGGGVRSGVVPPKFRGRFVEGRLRRISSFGFQWKPKTIYKSGGGGASGGGGGNVSCEVALAPTPGGVGGERVGFGGGSSGCVGVGGGEVSSEVGHKIGLAPTPTPGGGGGDESCGGKTTVMIKNIPNQYRRHMLIEFIDKLCEKNQLEYDFLYLPMDFQRKNSLGYAFVNFTSAAAATRIREMLQGYKWGCIQTHCGSFTSSKICEVTYARIQGKEALVQNFANSTFCCNNSKWLPVEFTPPRNGLTSSDKPRIIGRCRARISY